MNNENFNGLGIVNTKNDSCTVGTPLSTDQFANVKKDDRLIETDSTIFTDVGVFSEYIRNWFMKTGVVNISEVTDVCVCENSQYSFGVTMLSDASRCTYIVVPTLSADRTVEVVNRLKASATKPNNVVVCISYGFIPDDMKRLCHSIGIQIIDNNEIYDINGAICSTMPYLGVGNRLHNKLAKELNAVYKVANKQQDTFQDDIKSIGSDFVNSFKEGFGQLKESLFSAIGIGDTLANKTPKAIEGGNTPNIPASFTPNTPNTSNTMSTPEFGTDITPGTMAGPELEYDERRCGDDIVTPGTLDKPEIAGGNVIHVQGVVLDKAEEVSETTGVSLEKAEDVQVTGVNLNKEPEVVEDTTGVSLEKTSETMFNTEEQTCTEESTGVSLSKTE